MLYQIINLLQHPPEQQSNVGAPKLEYPGQLPKLSNREKHFVSQLLLEIPKDAVSTTQRDFCRLIWIRFLVIEKDCHANH